MDSSATSIASAAMTTPVTTFLPPQSYPATTAPAPVPYSLPFEPTHGEAPLSFTFNLTPPPPPPPSTPPIAALPSVGLTWPKRSHRSLSIPLPCCGPLTILVCPTRVLLTRSTHPLLPRPNHLTMVPSILPGHPPVFYPVMAVQHRPFLLSSLHHT